VEADTMKNNLLNRARAAAPIYDRVQCNWGGAEFADHSINPGSAARRERGCIELRQ